MVNNPKQCSTHTGYIESDAHNKNTVAIQAKQSKI